MKNPFRKPYIVKRAAPGSYVNGYYTEGDATDVTISASVQPLNMKEMEALADGQRTGEVVKIYSDEQLYPAQQDGENQVLQKADVLIYNGHEWTVVSCSRNQSTSPLLKRVNHYKSYAVRRIGS